MFSNVNKSYRRLSLEWAV